jgi:hypothetical protein
MLATAAAAPVVARAFWYANVTNLTSQLEQTLIATTGNTANFGTFSNTISSSCASGSTTRGVTNNGIIPASSGTYQSAMFYFTFGTTGTVSTFGNTSLARSAQGFACANKTRMVSGLGQTSTSVQQSELYYVTIATTGNSTSFGNANKVLSVVTGADSPTYGYLFFGSSASVEQSQIQYITIATTGNSAAFGNLSTPVIFQAGSSNSTRAVVGTGYQPSGLSFNSQLYYFTLGTSGTQTNFGTLSSARYTATATTSQTRMLFGGGSALSAPTKLSQIDYITVATTGNGTLFGYMTATSTEAGACSNDHGGLQ